jgi:hypothetical protein
MSSSRSIFYDDWRNCLRTHYMHVIRSNDRVTEPTLRRVLLSVGFSEAEIQEMAVVASMRDTDTSPEDLPRLDGQGE